MKSIARTRVIWHWLCLIPAVFYPAIAQAAPLSLSEAPLFVSTAVEPNVMLLIDNSGSMNNIIWAAAYDSTTTYPSWGFTSTGTINYSSIGSNDCSSGWKRGTRSGTAKCLRLPDPVGSGGTRYSGNYLNYLFDTNANNADLRTVIPNDYRMNVAKTVATNLVNTTSGMRFGVASFNAPVSGNQARGGKIDQFCGSSRADVTTAIADLSAETWTPLAESLYEVTRYFRGMSSYYNSGTSYTSPIQYRCQKNFTIVVTDGLPTYDRGFPSNDPDDANSAQNLPNWDDGATGAQSDGPLVSEGDEGDSLYLDDIAKFGYDIDMQTTGSDTAGVSYQDARYPKQNMNTYTVGFAVANQMLQDAAAYGRGQYLTANDADGLTAALNAAISNIRSMSSSAAAVATNSTSLNTGSQVFVAKFNSEHWSGTLLAAPISTAGVVGAATWSSDTLLVNPTATNRVIVSYKPSTSAGIPFRWPALPATPTASELDTAQSTALTSASVLNYLRGDESNEGTGGTQFRSRPTSKLGDIVNSSPQYVGKPVGQYENENLFRQAYAHASYLTFRNAQLGRTPMVYVGANDGMLHGFDASTGADKGKELLAFIPNQVYPNLISLSEKNYTHKYYVDGSPTVADAQIDGVWKTVLAGGLNNGGKSIFALDVTDPSLFTEANAEDIVMWEYTDPDLGYTFSKPMIVKTNTGQWAAIFGNGYNNSGNGHAVLFVVDLEDGSLIKKITTKQGTVGDPNGLSTVNGIDSDGNGTVDYIFGGDLLGNMWKFNIGDTNANNWSVAYGSTGTPAPLYQAKDNVGTGAAQSITTRPEVSFHPTYTDTFMVYFGTGKYLETTDKTNAQTQTFYGIWDNGATVSSVTTRNSTTLLQQTFSDLVIGGRNYRVPTATAIDWSTHQGWYQDLPSSRERVVGTPLLLKGIMVYSTFIPSTDPCLSGGTGYLMAVDFRNGGLPPNAVFDTNGATAGLGATLVGGVEMEVGSGGSNVIGGDGISPVAISPAAACDPADTSCVPCAEHDARLNCQQPLKPPNLLGERISWRELIQK